MSNTSPTVQGATWRWMVSCWSVCRGCSASKAPLSVLRLLASGFWSSLWHAWIKLIFYIHHSNSQPHSQSAFHTQDTQVHPHPQIHAPVINRSNIYPASSSPTLSDPLPEWWLKKKNNTTFTLSGVKVLPDFAEAKEYSLFAYLLLTA